MKTVNIYLIFNGNCGEAFQFYKEAFGGDFEEEKKKLIGNIQRVQQLGREAFEGKEHINFGKIDAQGWNNMFANHLNHHLSQFGV